MDKPQVIVVQRDPAQYTAWLRAQVEWWLSKVATIIGTLIALGIFPNTSVVLRVLTAAAAILGELGFRGIAAAQPPRIPLTTTQRAALSAAQTFPKPGATTPLPPPITRNTALDDTGLFSPERSTR